MKILYFFRSLTCDFLMYILMAIIGIFGIHRMRVRKTVDNPDSQFVAMPQTITPAGIELNPTTEPIEEPVKEENKYPR